ncbi:hypothetical protein [Microvirga lenta]|uniref:hypothetical protein n=1 Tax=Microvirga lenta TaxID=2881337 RepID=UPI001CFFAD8C|nr:hypothetical protein [Microvirga lenta]MCB5177746.1 hypothetical protein [Microvirga lenta]
MQLQPSAIVALGKGQAHNTPFVSYRSGAAREERVGLALAILLPVAVLFAGPYQLFPPVGWVDPAIYLSHLLDPRGMIAQFGSTYFSARLPLILLGAAIHHVFRFEYANYILILVIDLVALTSVYALARRAAGIVPAVVATWWLGTNPLWVAAISSGYVDGTAIAFSLAAISVFGIASDLGRAAPRPIALAAVGCLVALCFFVHPLPAGISGLVLLIGSIAVGGSALLLRFVLWAGIAFTLVAMLLGLFMMALGGPFLFIVDVSPLHNAFAGLARPFIRPFNEWAIEAYRLGMPFAATVIGLALVSAYKGGGKAKWAVHLGLALLAVTILFLAGWDVIVGGLTLQSHFYASYLLIGQSLAVIGCAGLLLEAESRTVRASLPLLGAVAALIVVALSLQRHIGALVSSTFAIWGILTSLLALTAFLCLRGLARAAVWGLFCITLIAGIANADTRRIFNVPGQLQSMELYGHLVRIRQAIEGMSLNGRQVMLWLNRSEYTTGKPVLDESFVFDFYLRGQNLRLNFYDSLAGFWLWDRSTINFEMPTLHQYNLESLQRVRFPTTIILACIYPENCDRGREALEQAGIATRVRARTLVGYPGLTPITLLALDNEPRSGGN